MSVCIDILVNDYTPAVMDSYGNKVTKPARELDEGFKW